jgi:hypothetical protein
MRIRYSGKGGVATQESGSGVVSGVVLRRPAPRPRPARPGASDRSGLRPNFLGKM